MRIKKNEPAGPPVLHIHISKDRKHSRNGGLGKTFNSNYLNKVFTYFRNRSSPEFLPAEKSVEMHGAGGKMDWLTDAGNAELKILQEGIINLRRVAFSYVALRTQSGHLEHGRKP